MDGRVLADLQPLRDDGSPREDGRDKRRTRIELQMTTSEFVATAKDRIERAACVLRRVIGVPDYDRYVAHVHAHHPGVEPMSHNDFVQQRMLDKYTKPGGRCC